MEKTAVLKKSESYGRKVTLAKIAFQACAPVFQGIVKATTACLSACCFKERMQVEELCEQGNSLRGIPSRNPVASIPAMITSHPWTCDCTRPGCPSARLTGAMSAEHRG
jgi:hypothetical protein